MNDDRQQRADGSTKEALEAFYRRDPLVVVESPPGGGKSGIIVRAAALGWKAGDNVLIGAQSQDQALELARSFNRLFPKIPLTFLASREKLEDSTKALEDHPSVVVTRSMRTVAPGASIVIANTNKWGFVKDESARFDALIIDEAYQMHSALFDRIAGLGSRYFLVGDPGQIQPIVRADVRAFRTRPDAPHRPAPAVALHRMNGTLVKLPISRRLVDDTASVVQRVFYPNHPFEGLTRMADRSLEALAAAKSASASQFLERVSAGQSLVGLRVSGSSATVVDEDVARNITELVESCIGQRIRYNGKTETVTPEHIGVVCARTAQVSALQSLVPPGVYVETANRMQGLERPIVFAWHPVSGVLDPSEFHLEVGRLCVALSRHLVACALVYRENVRDRLGEQLDLSARSLASHEGDLSFSSLLAHQKLMDELTSREIVA